MVSKAKNSAATETKETADTAITAVSDAVPMPEKKTTKRKSKYPFDDLEQGQSFGIVGRTAHSVSSIVSNQNRKHKVEKKDENGNVIYKTKDLKGADGTVTQVPTDKPEYEYTKKFFAVDVENPAKDPDGATARVFRSI